MPSGPLLVLTPSESKRFWGQVRVDEPDECWLWTGKLYPDGSGRLSIRGIPLKVSQLSYFIHWGLHPYTGLVVCHTCDDRACVNPMHLWLGTQAENMADCRRKGRTCAGDKASLRRYTHLVRKGVNHHNARLTDHLVAKIRMLRKSGLTQRKIAKKFGIKQPQVSRICHGVRWSETFQKEYVSS